MPDVGMVGTWAPRIHEGIGGIQAQPDPTSDIGHRTSDIGGQ
jgi:hypothetical protein